MSSNALRLGTSNSDTKVQYCSALRSVITRILPMPDFSMSFDIARNFSTRGRTLPGLQYMISRISSMTTPRWWKGKAVGRTQRRPGAVSPASRAADRSPLAPTLGPFAQALEPQLVAQRQEPDARHSEPAQVRQRFGERHV